MYWLDTTILVILGIGAVFGLLTGFLWQIARILGLAGALAASLFLNDWASHFLLENVLQGSDSTVAKGAAYVTVFAIVYLAFYLVAVLIDQTIRAVHLRALDRLLGAGVGMLKAGLILAALCFVMVHNPHPQTKEWVEKSNLVPILAHGMETALAVIPQAYKDDFNNNVKSLWDLTRRVTKSEP